jgi:predicted DNA binding CopG/RHH family protein
MNDWRDYKLDNDEVDLLESIENREWQSIGNIEERKENLKAFFNQDYSSVNLSNINVDKNDLDKILDKSNKLGIDYKKLIENLVHDFAIGKIAL